MDSAIPIPMLTPKVQPDAPLVEQYLVGGKLTEGEKVLQARLRDHNDDDQARFGLGVLQFLQAVEGFSQDLYIYGLKDPSHFEIRGPHVAGNPKPLLLSYKQFRNIFEKVDKKLTQAESTLSGITSADVRLPLHFGLIHLDLDGDGKTNENDSLWNINNNVRMNSPVSKEQAESFYIKFDRGDVHWLRGYCHVFLALCEAFLAYDCEDFFMHTAHLLFQRVDTPYASFNKKIMSKKLAHTQFEIAEITDVLAAIHLINWEVIAPERMAASLHHLEAVVTQSRESWKWIMAETDDDHEWLPNPRQTGTLPNMKVTEKMVVAWGEIMNESERILKGEHLIPFWRGDGTQGVNLRKVFLQPQRFDLMLWVQGTAAMPYLQTGEMTKGDLWKELRSEFGNQFPGFAFYFN